jgi:1-phosphatidylinositol phosphodiesterase
MSCQPQYCSKTYPKRKPGAWMGNVKNKLLSEMTIPGTHDTCTFNISLEPAQTQTYSITNQLEAGIRFLDIRCRHISNSFAIHHQMMFCGLMFGDVVGQCIEFLSKNPTECILMRVKEEYEPKDCTQRFEETFTKYFNAYDHVMSLTGNIPNLDDVRGKIWVIPNFIYYQGFDWSRAIVQDEYKVDTLFGISSKCDKVRAHLDLAKKSPLEALFINFCSGNGYLCWPSSIAKDTNKVSMGYVGRLGIIVMDYPGEDAIQHLIEQNENK